MARTKPKDKNQTTTLTNSQQDFKTAVKKQEHDTR